MKKITCFLLASIIVAISSCSPEDSINRSEDQYSLEEFTSKHISISKDLFTLLANENPSNVHVLARNFYSVTSETELTMAIKSANILHQQKLLELYNELKSNNDHFISSNSSFYNLSEEDRRKQISAEIDKNIIKNGNDSQARLSCAGTRGIAENRCLRNYAIANASAAIGGVFSGGIGLVVGWAIASAVFINCLEEATSDYNTCVANEQ